MAKDKNNSTKEKKAPNLLCFLQLIALNVEYKPIILGVISTLEVFILSTISALKLSNLADNAVFKAIETGFGMIEQGYSFALTPVDKIRQFGTLGGPCLPLDNFRDLINTDFEENVKAPYNHIKLRYFRMKQYLDLNNYRVEVLEGIQSLLAQLKQAIQELPDASIEIDISEKTELR